MWDRKFCVRCEPDVRDDPPSPKNAFFGPSQVALTQHLFPGSMKEGVHLDPAAIKVKQATNPPLPASEAVHIDNL